MSVVADFNYKYDYSPVLLWQYSNAPNIKKIIENEQSFVDVAITQFKDEFDKNIFNLTTCDSNGLDLWGRLLGVQRPEYNGVLLTDSQYRLLLQSRIMLLIWDGSCYGLNMVLKKLFPNVIFKIEDNFDMTVNIIFASGLTEEQETVLRLGYNDPITGEYVYTFLPRPAGVDYNISFNETWSSTLGFEGMTETTNMGGAYNCADGDTTGATGIENPDGGVFYK